jgi:GH35 family endo-1,4-beta-xylanase
MFSLAVSMIMGRMAMAADWRTEADARIEQIRKGDFTLAVHDADGKPVTNAAVRVRMTRHHFHFGTCIGGRFDDPSENTQRYLKFIRKNFNTLVSENDMKWYSNEAQRDQFNYERADQLMKFAVENKMAVRGHCLFWSKPKFVQGWVRELSADELRAKVEQRLEMTVPRFKGKLIAWDVNNEMLDGWFFQDTLGPNIRAHMFRRAHELDPDVPLFVNEYGILDNDAKLKKYMELIRDLINRGAPVGGIGIQEHAAERFAGSVEEAEADRDRPERAGRGALIPEDVWRRLDRLSEFGVPIHLTEISSKTADPIRRADTLEMLFRVGFAHKCVDSILLWGFWAKRHWLGPDAALVDENWNLLPAGERILNLMHKEWSTDVAARTEATGKVRFRGYYGTYAVEKDGQVMGEVLFTPTRSETGIVVRAAR